METVELKCEKRATQTKGDVRALRRNGRIPGVIYGPKTPPTALTVDSRELRERVAKASVARIIRFSAPGSELDSKHVIIKQIQRAPISGDIIHADFYEVNLNERIRVAVPLRFVGRAIGVADGGILQPLVRQIEVESLPLEIPELIEVDVSELGIH